MLIGWILGALLIAPAGLSRRIGFWGAFGVCLITSPLIGLFIVFASAQKNPKGCTHCGNAENETRFCSVCGKDESGRTREVMMADK